MAKKVTKSNKASNPGLFGEIYAIVSNIPKGKVATYGMIAALSGNPRRSRIVGYALHINPQPALFLATE